MTKRLLPLIAILLLVLGCKKSTEIDSTSLIKKQKIISEIGFNPDLIKIYEKEQQGSPAPLEFSSIEEAKIYLLPFTKLKGTTISGNIAQQKKIKDNFDAVQFVKEFVLKHKTKVIKKTTSSDPTGLITCDLDCQLLNDILPYVEDGGGSPSGNPSLNYWMLFSGYNVNFNWSQNSNGSIQASNFNSNIIGLHLGVSWQQASSSFNVFPNSSLIYFSIYGYQSYNIIVEGIGTIYTQNVTINGIYNTNTGAYSLTVQ